MEGLLLHFFFHRRSCAGFSVIRHFENSHSEWSEEGRRI